MGAGRIFKRVLERVTKGYFLGLVRGSYERADGWEHARVKAFARRYFRLNGDKGTRGSVREQWIMDFLLQAHKDLFRSGYCSRSLGPAKIGYQDLLIEASASDSNSSLVYLFGFSDNLSVFDAYSRFIKQGTAAIDVGSNIGAHALVMSRLVGEKGAVFAFEPIERLCSRIESNLALNSARNVCLIRRGISDKSGIAGFDDNPGDFNIGKGKISSGGRLKIELSTLDEELKALEIPVSLIKLDIEGKELDALRGSRATLAKYRPAVVLEYDPRGVRLSDLKATIPYAFKAYRIPYTFDGEYEEVDSGMKGVFNVLILPEGTRV